MDVKHPILRKDYTQQNQNHEIVIEILNNYTLK
jgi:hypothetical protein